MCTTKLRTEKELTPKRNCYSLEAGTNNIFLKFMNPMYVLAQNITNVYAITILK